MPASVHRPLPVHMAIPRDSEMTEMQKLYLFTQEMRPHNRPHPNYMQEVQSRAQFPPRERLRPSHRRQLVDWLYELSQHYYRYTSKSETFQLAVNLLDRASCLRPLALSEYQRLGAACFMIACKIAETHPPSCRELSDLSGGAFPPSGLRVMELWILTVLSWNLNPPTPHMFLDYFLDLFLFKTEVKMSLFTVANQYLDLIQREYEFVAYRPSVQAAAALKCTLRGEGYTNFHDVMAHELDRQSLQPAVLISSISIPRMVDIDACASAITVKVGPYAISRMHPSHCTANPAPTHATRVKNGLATPVNYQEVCKSVSHDDRGTALSKKRPASRAMNEIRKRAAPYPTPTEQQEAPIFEEPSSPFS